MMDSKSKTGRVRRENTLIDNAFSRLFTVSLLGMVSSFLCNIIDSIVTGQFLGSGAVTAMALVSPLVMVTSLISCLFVSGTSQLCIRNMGKADIDGVNRVFSTMTICSMLLCFVSNILIFLFSPLYIRWTANGVDEAIITMAIDYIRGYSFICVPMGLSILLNGLMMMDNDPARSLGSSVLMLVSDSVLDLVNVCVIHGGMLGMAMASVISCLIGLTYLLLHFRKPGHLLRFNPGNLYFGDVKEVLAYGVAGALPALMSSIRTLCFNSVLLKVGGADSVAAHSVAGGTFIIFVSLLTTVQSTTSAVSGLSYGEEDVVGLENTIKNAFRFSYNVYTVYGLLVFVFAPVAAGMFINDPTGNILSLAVKFIRYMVFQYAMVVATYVLTGSFTGCRRIKENYLVSVFRGGVFPCATILGLGMLFGLPGICMSFPVTGILTLLLCLVILWAANHRFPVKARDLLILPKNFGADPSECFETAIHNQEEAIRASERAYGFCLERGEEKRTATYVSLFIEEMAKNSLSYGFEKTRNGRIEVKLILRAGKKLLQLKDNGKPFNPKEWLERNHPEDPATNIGIRMVTGLAKRIEYVPAMKINNLMVFL